MGKKADKSVRGSSKKNDDVKIDATTDGKTDSKMDTTTNKKDAQKKTSVNEDIASGPAESDKTIQENPGPAQKDENTGSDKDTDKNIAPSSVLDQPDKTADEKIDPVQCNKNSENMDVEKNSVEMKIPVKRKIEADAEVKENAMSSKRHAGITRLCFEEDDDSNEETVIMTYEEVKAYLIKKVTECIDSPVNPLYALQQRAVDLKFQLAAKAAEYKSLCFEFRKLHEDQEKFLRHAGVLPKIQTISVGAVVDLPYLPSNPLNTNPPKVGQQSLLKNKELSITRVDNRQVNVPQPKKNKVIECIDLTDDTDDPVPTPPKKSSNVVMSVLKHPAPLPPRPISKANMPFPPKPSARIYLNDQEVRMTIEFPKNSRPPPAPILRYEVFGYPEDKNAAINTLLWKKFGIVECMGTTSMMCTLTQFVPGSRYHLTVRAVDVKGEYSHYSEIMTITYAPKTPPATTSK